MIAQHNSRQIRTALRGRASAHRPGWLPVTPLRDHEMLAMFGELELRNPYTHLTVDTAEWHHPASRFVIVHTGPLLTRISGRSWQGHLGLSGAREHDGRWVGTGFFFLHTYGTHLPHRRGALRRTIQLKAALESFNDQYASRLTGSSRQRPFQLAGAQDTGPVEGDRVLITRALARHPHQVL